MIKIEVNDNILKVIVPGERGMDTVFVNLAPSVGGWLVEVRRLNPITHEYEVQTIPRCLESPQPERESNEGSDLDTLLDSVKTWLAPAARSILSDIKRVFEE